MVQVDIIRPQALSASERQTWQAFRVATPAFASPLLSAAFAELVASVRDDVVVAVARRKGRILGFLPHHRRPGRFARPVGAPFSDYHAFVSEPEPAIEGSDLLAAAGIGAFRFSGLIDPYCVFEASRAQVQQSHQIAIGAEGRDYLEGLRAASPKRFKNLRRLVHKLDREVGELSITAPQRDPAILKQLLAWKSEQLRRTGLHDVVGAPWTQALMQAAFAQQRDELSGLLITLHAGDRLVAGHFGVREGDRYHPWIAAHDPAFAAYSPGTVFLWKAIEAMGDIGLRTYDLSGGHDHYKKPFASGFIEVCEGVARRPGPPPVTPPARLLRLQRRMDQIAAVELTLAGRVGGVVNAVIAQGRRKADLARIGSVADA